MHNFEKIFDIKNHSEFKKQCLDIYNFQYENNMVYQNYCNMICEDPTDVNEINKIPFLPISFFKTKKILSTDNFEKVFYSSGTTTNSRSKHFISSLKLYQKSFINNFKLNYSDITQYTILALLPNYYDNKDSSLIYMIEKLIKLSKSKESGFFLDDYINLSKKLIELDTKKERKTILIGVPYALLDMIDFNQFQLNNTIIMETGGMKGRRKEMVRTELHEKLKRGFGVSKIHSEYGMTELLSQAYSKGDGIFKTPSWMKVIIRDINDAQNLDFNKKSGAINIIDLANYNSCSFIATDDMGKHVNDDEFELIGRVDNSDIRGCNLLV
ncbi:MAG: acyl transferase [Flavobacteriaceae bacterium]|nr:acyl transferase [Flavobacteriaceae bacterium]